LQNGALPNAIFSQKSDPFERTILVSAREFQFIKTLDVFEIKFFNPHIFFEYNRTPMDVKGAALNNSIQTGLASTW
jgi:hypothetical protein